MTSTIKSSQIMLHSERNVPVIAVTEGFHSGAVVALDQLSNESGVISVGAGLACDISLSDREVVDRHYQFSIRANRASIEAIGADIKVNNTSVTQGMGYRCRLPVDIQAGDSVLRVGYPGKMETPSRVSGRLLKVTPLVALAMVFVSMFLVPLIGVSEANQVVESFIDAPSVTPASVAERPSVTAMAARNPDIKNLLEQRLSEASLSHLNVTEQGSLIRVEGRIKHSEQDQWLQVQEGFDRDFSVTHTLRAAITVLPDMPKPNLQIKALWLGENPHIVSKEGDRYFPGDELEGGWRLDEISPEQVVLSRRDERYRLTL